MEPECFASKHCIGFSHEDQEILTPTTTHIVIAATKTLLVNTSHVRSLSTVEDSNNQILFQEFQIQLPSISAQH